MSTIINLHFILTVLKQKNAVEVVTVLMILMQSYGMKLVNANVD